jgi:hypothetical protein
MTPDLFEARALLACGASLSAAALAAGFAGAEDLDLALWDVMPAAQPATADPVRAGMSERTKRQWAEPGYREKLALDRKITRALKLATAR